ncbi:uncharacterized protein LOC127245112 isoform X7 [Andrographis paniculata]|uniref:uncharacterized protein LOC127245112 isoform X7 n=1 Tax=Andrographis paniculata TaxID=175694 RepID=UPI0021E95C0C|nr:uncharacterized protein LOC127245112 isoform X7 [Andrographis paniculata]
MPPEQFPWDRRDFRKHDRSGSDPRFGGGGFGGGWANRWREPQHHPHAPPSFQHHHNHQPQPPWYSDFRTSRPIPPGHGKQGGWHMYPDEAGHVFMPFGSRYNDRDAPDDNFRPFGSRGEAKYIRNNRESRGSFSQKDWRSHSWEPAVSSSVSGRPTTEVNNPKAIANNQTFHKVNNQKATENTQSGLKVNNQKVAENGQAFHKVNNQKVSENAQACHKVNNQKAVENAQTCPKVNNQKAAENAQTCPKVNNQKAAENAQTCPKVNNQKAAENAQTCLKVNNQKAAENAQTCPKVNNQKAAENAQTCPKVNNQNAAENAQTCPKVNNQKAAENAQTCAKVNNQKAAENAQTCAKVNNQKAVENAQTCYNVNNQKAAENAHTCHKTSNQKAVDDFQTCLKASNQKAAENAQTCHKTSNQKAGDDSQTCHKTSNQNAVDDYQTYLKASNLKAVENGQICHKENVQKAVENVQTCHKDNSVSNDSAHPPPDLLSSPSQHVLKEKQEKNDAAASGTLASLGQNPGKEKDLGSIDWKPLKWSRSGSLVSRGSGFSHSSSSKSLGVDSTDIMSDLQKKDATPDQSSAAAASAMTSSSDPSDETTSRKKPRLGWGEGLAKYEKKKVDGHDDDATKERLVVGATSAGIMLSPSVNQVLKSPRFVNVLDCASPATPASVACSSSPGTAGIVEKESINIADSDNNTANLCCSPGIMPLDYHEGTSFNLENLELSSIANLSLFINDLLQSSDPNSMETGYVRTSSMNKLLVCKVDILKALEVTESEIDSLETELKTLSGGSNSCHPFPAACHLKSGEPLLEPCEEHAAASGNTAVPPPLQIASSGSLVDEDAPTAQEGEDMEAMDEDIDSPYSATSKLVGAVVLSGEDICTSKTAESVEGSVMLNSDNSRNSNPAFSENGLGNQDNVCPVDVPYSILRDSQNSNIVGDVSCDHIYDSVLASSKESATRAVEELNKLLPDGKGDVGTSNVSGISSFQRDSLMIKEKFVARKWSHKFKEKVVTLKFKIFQHFWKEGRVVSVRKLQGKSHKMFDLSRTGYRRNRSSVQSRISYFAGSHPIVPAEEVIDFINGLLSSSPFKPCRNFLKMPAFILDKETRMSRFISNNGLVENPGAAEKERSCINPWTAEEQEIFIDKLAVFGKDFSKIAGFLEHKTIADCVEFYYKNHKSTSFERARKNRDKQSKPQATAYLVATAKRSSREVNAVNLDILGDASIIAAAVDDGVRMKKLESRPRILLGPAGSHKLSSGDDSALHRSNSLDMYCSETAAADVLAGICGSLSSEAMSSCITSSFDPSDRCQDWKCPLASSGIKLPLTPDVTQNVDDECSDESCAEIDTVDWTDEEKSIFIRAISSYGKDFARISQCVGTKSNDQCKIFFSKARKCLQLDQIHPGADGAEPGDVNEGGSDVEDGCVLQNVSVICSDNSENKSEENLIAEEAKMDHMSDSVEPHKLKPDVNACGEGSSTCLLDSMAASPVLTNTSANGCQVDAMPAVDISAGNKEQNDADGSDLKSRTMCLSSNSNSVQVELGVDCGMPSRPSLAADKALSKAPDGQRMQNLPEEKLDGGNMARLGDTNLADVVFSSAASDLNPENQLDGNVSQPSADAHSSVQVLCGSQEEAGLKSYPPETPDVTSLQPNDLMASVAPSALFSVPITYQRHSVGNALDKRCLQTMDTTGDCQQQRPGNSLLESMQSSQILRGYPVPVHAMKEMNLGVKRKNLVLPQDISIRDGMLHLDRHTDFSLQKCTGSRHQSEVFKKPSFQEQSCGDKSRPQPGCSSGSDKPSRSGDVKLFGKILVSSNKEPNSELLDSGPDNSHLKTSGQSLSLKLSVDEKVHLHSSKSKFDCNNFLGTENIPVGSFGLWDGGKTQAGYPLLDSTLLLSKYPAAFANHSIRLEQPPLCRVSKSNDNPFNGVSVIPRELNSNIGLSEFPVLRNLELQQQQPLTVDMRQPQDVAFSEMQRRIGFEAAMAGMQQQQQAQMMVGINNVVGRGVILHNEQFPGASNPVKKHYATAPNFNLQAGSGWRMDK